jgi:DNA-binding MarR family transcriptional regulator
MADVISKTLRDRDDEIVDIIELLFFAYRDFTSDPDAILDQFGFGRAHHRVLHFAGRRPGMTVAQLLDILRITKQSLARVLKELIAKGYVYQKEGAQDRRQRLVYLTPEGEALRQRLMRPQYERVRRALGETGSDGKANARGMLYQLVSPQNRDAVLAWLDARDGEGEP